MSQKNLIKSLFIWLTQSGAYTLLTASDEKLNYVSAERFKNSAMGIMFLSFGWGLACVGIWGGAWKLFGEGFYAIPAMPIAAVLAVMCLWLYKRAILSLAEISGGKSSEGKALSSCIICIFFMLSFLVLRRWDSDTPADLPHWLQWIWPMALYRVLILMPIWGAWSMLITCQFCKPNAKTEFGIRTFAQDCGIVKTAILFAVLLAVTMIYFHYLGWWRFCVPAITIIVASLSSPIIYKRQGGLTRDLLLAVNILTQLAFLLSYLVFYQ